MGLEEYKRKRYFNKTPEPTGGNSHADQLIFVIQKHQASHLHYDFRLELRGSLKSWAVPKGPSMNPEEKRLASLVEDHPFDYKDFEGIIPAGNYGAGTVIIWDEGTYTPIESAGNKKEDEKILVKQFYAGKMQIKLKGQKLKGGYQIIKTPERGENAWLLIKIKDSSVRKTDILKKDKSIISNLSIEEMTNNKDAREWQSNRSSTGQLKETKEINNTNTQQILSKVKKLKGAVVSSIPKKIEPMYATLTKEAFDDAAWEFEIKWDGYRSIAYLENGKVSLKSRSNQSFNYYTPIVEALEALPVNAVVDGEIVVLGEDGKADFEALQQWQRTKSGHLVYYVFDIIWLEGYNLQSLPLEKRKEILQLVLPKNDIIRYSSSIEEHGKEFFELAKENKLEGIIAKKKSSKYLTGKRVKDWLKVPTANRQEFVIGGWTESSSGRTFKSLLFGYYDKAGKLQYFGHAGHGFKESEMPAFLRKLKSIEVKKSPFANAHDRTEDLVHFVKPELVGVFEYKTVTSGGKIRHPAVFYGLRTDKPVEEVVEQIEEPGKSTKRKTKEQVTSKDSNWPIIEKQKILSRATHVFDDKEVEYTNIEKELWKGIMKADLLIYYHEIYPYIIPHIKDRPLSLHVKHISPTKPGIYIKDMEGREPQWAELFSVKRKHKRKGKRDQVDYLVMKNEATLQYIINLGCIDVNPWTSTIHSPGEPDFIIIDLDPSDDDFNKVIETAKAAKEFFDQHKIFALPKTSGKTGIHLYLPCSGFSFPEARTIAENICSGIHNMIPDITTTDISIDSRGNKLYIDPNQNDYADTVAAPYSVRPYYQPTVSTPLDWKEVKNNLEPSMFTIKTIMNRLDKKGELFVDVLSNSKRVKNNKALQKFL